MAELRSIHVALVMWCPVSIGGQPDYVPLGPFGVPSRAASKHLLLPIVRSVQILRVYADGALVARTDRNNQPSAYNVSVPVKGGSRVILALTGSVGEPYGGYRGQPGLRCALTRG